MDDPRDSIPAPSAADGQPGGARTTGLLLALIFLVLLVVIVWLFTSAGLFTAGGVPPVP